MRRMYRPYRFGIGLSCLFAVSMWVAFDLLDVDGSTLRGLMDISILCTEDGTGNGEARADAPPLAVDPSDQTHRVLVAVSSARNRFSISAASRHPHHPGIRVSRKLLASSPSVPDSDPA